MSTSKTSHLPTISYGGFGRVAKIAHDPNLYSPVHYTVASSMLGICQYVLQEFKTNKTSAKAIIKCKYSLIWMKVDEFCRHDN